MKQYTKYKIAMKILNRTKKHKRIDRIANDILFSWVEK